ncbi:MAG: hypothetical protein ACLUMK_03495 [Christensenellales bacterium]
MRKRIALCMVALVLTLLGPGMALVVSRSLLDDGAERARALGEEAAIARALTLETAEETLADPLLQLCRRGMAQTN